MISLRRANQNLLLNLARLPPQRLDQYEQTNDGHQAGINQTRSLRIWRRALPFPPNHNHQHHLFLPNLQSYLDEQEALTNPVELIDVGVSTDKFFQTIGVDKPDSRDGKRREASKKTQKLLVSNETDLVKLVNLSKEKQSLDYGEMTKAWALSEEGKHDIRNLAHHYQIFRDLFSSPSQLPAERAPVAKAKIPQMQPPPDLEPVEVLQKWFPGAVPLERPKSKKVFFFTPHVPIYVEFAVPESRVTENSSKKETSSQDSLITSPVVRGNHILPAYASEKPSVVIDARGSDSEKIEPYFNLIDVNGIKLITNSKSASGTMFSLGLFNLDTHFGDDKPVCHWFVSNIKKSKNGDQISSEENIPFLSTFGIRGFGYHRYAFVLYQHDKPLTLGKIDPTLLVARQFDPLSVVEKDGAVPVGLSWFQTTWDYHSNKVFHDTLNMRAPVYENIQKPESKTGKQTMYPHKAPFNLYLDHFRDPKEINKGVLLERLKSLDPFDYKKAFEVDPLPNAYPKNKQLPSWLWTTQWKQRNRLGAYRLLRPASALRPHNNNSDLDNPFWPHPRKLDVAMRYPDGTRRPKAIRTTKWVLPPHEHPTYRVVHEDHVKIREEEEKRE